MVKQGIQDRKPDALAKHERQPGGIIGEDQQHVAANANTPELKAKNHLIPIHEPSLPD